MLLGLESVAVIFIIMAFGFFFETKKLWPDNSQSSLSMIVVKVAAPCLAFTSIASSFDRAMLLNSLVLLLISALHILFLFLCGKIFSKLLKLEKKKKAVLEVTYSYSNVIFIGLPVNQIVFGNDALPFLFVYYVVILILFWGPGASQIVSAGQSKKTLKSSIINILNPGFIGVIIGTGLGCLGIGVPRVLDTSLSYLGALTVPLSLLVIGSNLIFIKDGIPKLKIDDVLVLLGKFILSPLIMFIMLNIANIHGTAYGVFMLSASMPCHMQTAILAKHYDVEPEYAARFVGLSTLASIVVIPAVVWVVKLSM